MSSNMKNSQWKNDMFIYVFLLFAFVKVFIQFVAKVKIFKVYWPILKIFRILYIFYAFTCLDFCYTKTIFISCRILRYCDLSDKIELFSPGLIENWSLWSMLHSFIIFIKRFDFWLVGAMCLEFFVFNVN